MNSKLLRQKQLSQILDSLEQDPLNPSLLSHAALLAFDADDLPLCQELIERLASVSPVSDAMQQLQALLPVAQKRFGTSTH
jgi:hypothetical protein